VIHAAIILRHARDLEALLELLAAALAAEAAYAFHAFYSLVEVIHDEPGDALVYDLRNGPATQCDDRSTAGHGFDHRESEGLGPVDGKQQGKCVSQKACLVEIADFADEFDELVGGPPAR
jgi:hypothetical protein